MAGANALLLKALLDRDCRIDFFSKSSFVDPRPILGTHPLLNFHETGNPLADGIRRKTEALPLLGLPSRRLDSHTYHRAILRAIAAAHTRQPFNLCLWLGDYARGRVSSLPNTAFAQGPPGTDARAVLRHFGQIKKISGSLQAWKWWCLARLRLSPTGLPPFRHSDHVIVGSNQSKNTLVDLFGFKDSQVSTLPYPVDLQTFHPGTERKISGTFRCLWLGRIVPRKRLDLFLDAAGLAIARGVGLHLTVAGDIRMVSGYETLIQSFRCPERLVWRKHVPRKDVPDLIRQHDLLIQPSEEEDFGSSVAEAQACGIPVIVGPTNGNRDYLGPRDRVMREYSAIALCDDIVAISSRKEASGAAAISRRTAEENFHIDRVADRLLRILEWKKAGSLLKKSPD